MDRDSCVVPEEIVKAITMERIREDPWRVVLSWTDRAQIAVGRAGFFLGRATEQWTTADRETQPLKVNGTLRVEELADLLK